MVDQELEIDLRPYFEVLFRHWYYIVLATGLAAGLAFIITASRPPAYEATALIAVTEPNFLMNFDSRIRTVDDGKPAYKAFPEFASSSELVNQVYAALDPDPEKIKSAEALRGKMEATSGDDISLILLTVTMPSPDEAALAANLWADLFIKKAHIVYGDIGEGEVAFFEVQMSENMVEL